jgi:hypothetical protein
MKVQLISWPPLWPYWPAYLALARTEQRFQNEKLRFAFAERPSHLTDEILRAEFYEAVNKDPTSAIALCEPGSPVRGEDARQSFARRFPVICRQPHWVLSRATPERSASRRDGRQRGRLWSFPSRTTSGDFVAGVRARLQILRPFANHGDLSSDLGAERDLLATLGPHDAVVTFTPWHQIDEDLPLRAVLLPGPSRDVTALQIPDSPLNYYSDFLATQIREILEEISQTQGDDDLMLEFLDRNFDLVADFIGRNSTTKPIWLDRDFLRSALSEYCRLGCYFPYRTIESAVAAELQKHVFDAIQSAASRAVDQVKSGMNTFLGSAPEWSALSFDQRRRMFEENHPLESGEVARPLWQILTHETGPRGDFAAVLPALWVKANPDEPAYQLAVLAAAFNRECVHSAPANGTHAARRQRCLGAVAGVVKPTDPVARTQCAACVFGGASVAVARTAATELAQGLGRRVGYWATGYSCRCPVTASDIQPLVDLFLRERRPAPRRLLEPASVAIYAPVDREEGHEPETVVGIWWKGEVSRMGRTNGTGRGMAQWQHDQEKFGRPVAWVGRWRRGDGRIDEFKGQYGATTPSTPDSPVHAGGKTLRQAREDFLSKGFEFGYTAVFMA